jgi:DNA adenine methylase
MVNFCCEKCKKEFSQKGNYTKHLNKKISCVVSTNEDIKKDNYFQKPFLKWVGGKTQIIKDIIVKIPTEINNYHELFLGGGSVLLAVLSLQKQNKIVIKNKIYAYDINSFLINVYKHIQTDKEELYEYINLYLAEYDNIKGSIINRCPTSINEAKTSKESYYYWIRTKYNTMDITYKKVDEIIKSLFKTKINI